MAGKGVRLSVVLLALAAASLLVWQGYAVSVARQGARLEVALVSVGPPPAGSDGSTMTGRLGANRSGDRVCFWIIDSDHGGAKRYLLFARHYSASEALALLDEEGQLVAHVGETVTAENAAPRANTAPAFCPTGTGMTVYDVRQPPS